MPVKSRFSIGLHLNTKWNHVPSLSQLRAFGSPLIFSSKFTFTREYKSQSKRQTKKPRKKSKAPVPWRRYEGHLKPKDPSKIQPPELTNEEVMDAFKKEIYGLQTHAALFKQTNPEALCNLLDIHPMMRYYKYLTEMRAMDAHNIRNVTEALLRTARDSSVILARVPLNDRAPLLAKVMHQLAEYGRLIAEDLKLLETEPLRVSIINLMLLFERTAPAAGISLFNDLGREPFLLPSAIACYDAAQAPLSEIEACYNSSSKSDQDKAALVLVYIKRGHLEEAESLDSEISSDSPMAVRNKVIDSFIGFSPSLECAMKYYFKAYNRPHPAAMTRFLNKLWLSNKDFSKQLAFFDDYLKKPGTKSEERLKTVTYAVVSAMVESISPESTEQEVATMIKSLTSIYEAFYDHEILMNIMVTQFSRDLPQRTDIIELLFEQYSPFMSVVGCRVCLNALVNFSDDRAAELSKFFWEKRRNITTPLAIYDWLALKKATKGGRLFQVEWNIAGNPYGKRIHAEGDLT